MNLIHKEFLKVVLISVVVLIIDLIWLSLFLGKYFGTMVLKIQGSEMKINIIPAILSYFTIILSIYYLLFYDKRTKENKYIDSFILGLCVYGIFEFTSGAIFKDWEILPLIVDTLWGGVLYLSSYSILKYLFTLLNI